MTTAEAEAVEAERCPPLILRIRTAGRMARSAGLLSPGSSLTSRKAAKAAAWRSSRLPSRRTSLSGPSGPRRRGGRAGRPVGWPASRRRRRLGASHLALSRSRSLAARLSFLRKPAPGERRAAFGRALEVAEQVRDALLVLVRELVVRRQEVADQVAGEAFAQAVGGRLRCSAAARRGRAWRGGWSTPTASGSRRPPASPSRRRGRWAEDRSRSRMARHESASHEPRRRSCLGNAPGLTDSPHRSFSRRQTLRYGSPASCLRTAAADRACKPQLRVGQVRRRRLVGVTRLHPPLAAAAVAAGGAVAGDAGRGRDQFLDQPLVCFEVRQFAPAVGAQATAPLARRQRHRHLLVDLRRRRTQRRGVAFGTPRLLALAARRRPTAWRTAAGPAAARPPGGDATPRSPPAGRRSRAPDAPRGRAGPGPGPPVLRRSEEQRPWTPHNLPASPRTRAGKITRDGKQLRAD